MNCPACGTDNREGAHFCRRCGETLAEPPVSEAPVTAELAEVASEEPEGSPVEPVPASGAVGVSPEEPADASPEPQAGGEPGEGPAHETEGIVSEGEEVGEAGAASEPGIEAPAEPVEGEESEEATTPGEQLEQVEEEEPLPEPVDEVLAFWREEAESLVPEALGTVIADRYVVVEVLDAQEDQILYLAHDLRRCWQCGFEGDAPDEAFCAQCGAALDRKREVRLLELGDADAQPDNAEQAAVRLAHQDRTFLLLAESEPEVEAPAVLERICLLVGQYSDPGQVRELNEDSLLAMTLTPTYESQTGPVLGLFAVADGMGGHEGGEVASKMALQVLADQVLRAVVLPELAGEMVLEPEIVVRLRQAIMAANDAVYLARQKAGNDMGTTLTAAFIRDESLFLAHVGDCRAYRWNEDGLEQLSADHSVVASMIASGQVAPEEIYTHPHRSIIYRCIGDKPMVEVDADIFPLTAGDRLVLCSDGLWEMIRSEGIEDVMLQEADPQAACDLLVKHANAAGGDDNVSVMVIRVEMI